jgi:hypothetical protein
MTRSGEELGLLRSEHLVTQHTRIAQFSELLKLIHDLVGEHSRLGSGSLRGRLLCGGRMLARRHPPRYRLGGPATTAVRAIVRANPGCRRLPFRIITPLLRRPYVTCAPLKKECGSFDAIPVDDGGTGNSRGMTSERKRLLGNTVYRLVPRNLSRLLKNRFVGQLALRALVEAGRDWPFIATQDDGQGNRRERFSTNGKVREILSKA